jgi:hypothetical protein
MNRVSLQPHGELMQEGQGSVQQPLACLGLQVQLLDGCSLRSYFRMLEKYPVYGQLGLFYGLLMDQYRNCPAGGCCWEAFDQLELSKTVEMIGYPGNPRLEIFNIFQGVGASGSVEVRSLALEFLLDMPLRLGRLRHIVFGDNMDTFNFETVYTLFEFIDSIAWSLSFHGTPARCKL